ncbi:MAG: MFS transporter [Desulfurococcaceae archaeon]
MANSIRLELILNVGALLFFLGIYTILPFLSRYAVSLGATPEEVSLLGPALSIAAIGLRPLSGFLLDRGYLKKLIVAGLLCSTTAQIIYSISPNVAILYLGRILHGVGSAFFIPASIYTAALAGKGSTSALAWRSTMIGIAMVLGPAIGGFITSSLGYQWLFYASCAMLLASLTFHQLVLGKIKGGAEGGKGTVRDLVEASFIAASLSILCYSAIYNSITLYLPALHEELGIAVGITATAFTASSVANLASRLIFPIICKKVPFRITALLGFVLVTLSAVSIVANPASGYLVLWMVVFGLGAGVIIPSLQIMAVLGVKDKSRGLASGFYTAMFDAGNIVGPPLVMSLGASYMGALKATLVFPTTGSLVLLFFSTYMLLSGRNKVVLDGAPTLNTPHKA